MINKLFQKQRKKIEEIDEKIIKLLEERFSLVQQIGIIKKENKLKIVDPEREKKLIEKISKSSILSSTFIKNLYKLIFDQSYKFQ